MPGRTATIEPVRCQIDEAHVITGISVRIIRDQAGRGVIPGASKPGGRWLFVIEDLQRWATRVNRPTIVRSSKAGRGPMVPRAGRISRTNVEKTSTAYELALQGQRGRS